MHRLPYLLSLWLLSLSPFAAPSGQSDFVGREVCSGCHAEQAASWAGSHHDLAMQEVSDHTVLGDFSGVEFSHYGLTSTFYRKGDDFMVRTEGPDGKLHDYRIDYVFGVQPLQQYLVRFPGGRLQALSLAWDTRPTEEGGQRWFHLYPEEEIAHDDELHWTGPNQNWNNMCAECHSTGLEKNYDALARSFDTRWQEIDVSCEACHGPGSAHVSWARQEPGHREQMQGKGLQVQLDERSGVEWRIDSESGNAVRSHARDSEKEIGMCARCHSRRGPISLHYQHGEAFADHYRPRLIDAGMYYPDGQIQDEVYVYGSFLQSRMYHAGVTCSDCHDPHSLELRAPGNAVCLQCHQANRFNTTDHHMHGEDSAGASCAECHMPPRTYMVVDPRHDHSFRIPRPDLTVTLGTPNACNNCHTDKSADWAADAVRTHYGHDPQGFQTFAGALDAGRENAPGAGQALAGLIRDTRAPALARATALSAMSAHLGRQTFDTLQLGLNDDDALVRAQAVALLEQLPPQMRVAFGFPMLEDPVRLVRIEAARVLADIPPGDLQESQARPLDEAISEYIEAQLASAERAEAQLNLGNLYAARGQGDEAEHAFMTAIDLDPRFVPAYVNLAALYTGSGREKESEAILREAAGRVPDSGAIHHALGLSLVRQNKTDQALAQLRKAAKLEPDIARYIYVYAVAMNSAGQPQQAVLLLQGAHQRHPGDRDILQALIAFHRDLGNSAAAQDYAGKLQALPR